MIYHYNYNCYNVSEQPTVDEVSNIIFSPSSISVLVVLIQWLANLFKERAARGKP